MRMIRAETQKRLAKDREIFLVKNIKLGSDYFSKANRISEKGNARAEIGTKI